jgi:hypothetical protein
MSSDDASVHMTRVEDGERVEVPFGGRFHAKRRNRWGALNDSLSTQRLWASHRVGVGEMGPRRKDALSSGQVPTKECHFLIKPIFKLTQICNGPKDALPNSNNLK